MNKLRGQRAYLAGPIETEKDAGSGWRDDITLFLNELGCEALDPLKKPAAVMQETQADRDRWAKYKEDGDFEKLYEEGEMVRRLDLQLVDYCNFLIVNLDKTQYMCGTWEEIFSANYKKRPIIIMCPQGKKAIPMWLFWTLKDGHNMFFSDWDSVKDFLNKVDKGEIDAGKRWIFW